MKELTSNEISEVNGGILPLVATVVGVDVGLNLVFAAWYYAKMAK